MPRRLFSYLKKYAIYRRVLLSYFALVSTTVIVVSAVLFGAFNRQSMRDVIESGEATLEQTAAAVDVLREQVLAVGGSLVEEPWVVASLRADDIDRMREYQTNRVFLTLQAVYPFIRFVGLYNVNTDRYVSTEGLTAGAEREFIEHILHTPPTEFLSSFMRPINYTYPRATDTGTVLTFVLRPEIRWQRPNDSFILVNVELEYIASLIADRTRGYRGEVLLATPTGEIIAGDGDSGLADGAWLEESLRSRPRGAGTTSLGISHDGARYVVTHVGLHELGWSLFGVRSRAQLLSHSYALAWVTFAVALVIILTGAIASSAFTERIYDPLSRLVVEIEQSSREHSLEITHHERVNEYEVLSQAYRRFVDRVGLLEGALHDDLPLLRRTYVYSLLTGTQLDLPETPQTVQRITIDLAADRYSVILCRPDRLEEIRRVNTAEEISNAYLVLSRTMHEALEEFGIAVPVLIESDGIAVLIGGDDTLRTERIADRLQEAQVELHRQVRFTVSCSVSPLVRDHESIAEALRDARRLLRYRFFAGPASIVPAHRWPKHAETFRSLPPKLCHELSQCIRSLDTARVQAILEEVMRAVRENSYHGALSVCYQLSTELLYEFGHLQQFAPQAFLRHRRLMEDLSTIEFLSDAGGAITELCDTLMAIHRAEMANKTRGLYRQAVDFVMENYTNPGLSLEMAAEVLRVSSGHLGRVFAECGDQFFHDFLNSVRIERAKELLLHNEATIETISTAVGMRNTTYFFTLFKKHVGLTPARFRRSIEL